MKSLDVAKLKCKILVLWLNIYSIHPTPMTSPVANYEI